VTFVRDGDERTVTVVGHDESEPAEGLVAFSAPLVKAMLGAEVGEEIEVPGGGMVTVTAIAVPTEPGSSGE
jgi:transcription elongation GreA/GreB family factor